jgi:hypothetical protein
MSNGNTKAIAVQQIGVGGTDAFDVYGNSNITITGAVQIGDVATQ